MKLVIEQDQIYPIMGPVYHVEDFSDINLDSSHLNSLKIENEDDLINYMDFIRKDEKSKWLIGGYLERRSFYQSELFISDPLLIRDVHLGVDIWGSAFSPIYTPLDGRIHSFANNNNALDYGYTLIVEHKIKAVRFYTLYGHLSSEHFNFWHKGSHIKKGTQIANLGTKQENGGWLPHLHFQLILNMEEWEGDYPGVCALNDLEKHRVNCPNPQMLIKKAL